MSRLHQVLCGVALTALLPVTACSSDGRVAMNGNLRGASAGDGGGAPPPSGSGDAPAPSGSGGASSASIADDVSDGTTTTLATAGNLSGDIRDDGELDAGLDPLGRVSVDRATVLGAETGSGGALGVSVASDAQDRGTVASLGVLANGQVIGANEVASNGNGELIGVTANGEQAVGEGEQQQVSVDLLENGNTEGDLLSADALNNGEIADVAINGDHGAAEELAGHVSGLLNGPD